MCEAASFVVCKDNKVFWSKSSDRHTEIRLEHGLPENDRVVRNVQVEIVPPGKDYALPFKKWVFKVDQDQLPSWWDAESADVACRDELKVWAKDRLVRSGESRDCNDGDYLIVCGGTVNEVWGGTVNAVWGGTVNKVCGGTVGFYRAFSVKLTGLHSVVINHVGTKAVCHVGTEDERIVNG